MPGGFKLFGAKAKEEQIKYHQHRVKKRTCGRETVHILSKFEDRWAGLKKKEKFHSASHDHA